MKLGSRLLLFMLLGLAISCGEETRYWVDRLPDSSKQFAAGSTWKISLKRSGEDFMSGAQTAVPTPVARGWTSDSDVAIVESINPTGGGGILPSIAVIRLKSPGVATVYLEGEDGGVASATVKVAEPSQVYIMETNCMAQDLPVLVGHPVRIELSVFGEDGTELVGLPRDEAIEISPEGAIGEDGVALPPASEVTIRSRFGGDTRTIRTAEASDITGLSLIKAAPDDVVTRGQYIYFRLYGEIAGNGICYDPEIFRYLSEEVGVEVEVTTPDVCRDSSLIDLEFFTREVGTCEFQLTISEVNNGAGWSTQRSVMIVENE